MSEINASERKNLHLDSLTAAIAADRRDPSGRAWDSEVLCVDQHREVSILLEMNGPTTWIEAEVSLTGGYCTMIRYVTTATAHGDGREARFVLEDAEFDQAERILIAKGLARPCPYQTAKWDNAA